MARSSVTKKQEDPLPPIEIVLTKTEPWVAYTPDHPALAGRTYIGRNESEALMHAITDAHDFWNRRGQTITVRVED